MVLVTTIESPPPARATVAEDVPALSEAVPVGRNGVMEPMAMCFSVSGGQPMCSTITARLNAALVAVGTVVGLVVVSDGAQKPPIQYQD